MFGSVMQRYDVLHMVKIINCRAVCQKHGGTAHTPFVVCTELREGFDFGNDRYIFRHKMAQNLVTRIRG